jgi:hypothetical protein
MSVHHLHMNEFDQKCINCSIKTLRKSYKKIYLRKVILFTYNPNLTKLCDIFSINVIVRENLTNDFNWPKQYAGEVDLV